MPASGARRPFAATLRKTWTSRWTTAPRPVPCSTRWRARRPSFTGDGGYDQDRVYDSVAGAPPHGGRHRAAARDGSAERDGRDRTDAARPSSPAHRGARPDGLAEGVRVHEASPGRGRHREVEAGDRRRVRSRTDERRATEVAVATHALNRIADATPRVAHPYVMLQGCGSSQPPYQPPKRGHTISAAAPSAGRT